MGNFHDITTHITFIDLIVLHLNKIFKNKNLYKTKIQNYSTTANTKTKKDLTLFDKNILSSC